jgi:hypothetical protein
MEEWRADDGEGAERRNSEKGKKDNGEALGWAGMILTFPPQLHWTGVL